MRFQERVTVITGSGSELGRVLAHRFAAEGAALVVADVVGQRATTVAGGIMTDGTHPHTPLPLAGSYLRKSHSIYGGAE